MKRRFVILHGHMFKNAGTTFDWSLERNFGGNFIDHRDDVSMKKGHVYLREFIKKNSHLQAISSHHIQFPEPQITEVEILPAMIFRHPIDRVRSVYNFERQQNSDTPGAIAAKKMNLSNYVHWRLTDAPGPTIRDFQTRYCTRLRVTPKNPLSQDRFEEAWRFLQRLPILGLVECYDESMVVFEHFLQTYYSNINLAYVQQNVGQERRELLEARVSRTCDELGGELTKLLMQHNQYDSRLYDEARRILQKRIDSIADFDAKLVDFQQRCKRLNKNLIASSSLLSKFKRYIRRQRRKNI